MPAHQTAEITAYMEQVGRAARAASRVLGAAATAAKNAALLAMADGLCAAETDILRANAKDLDAAKKNKLSDPLRDRLQLTPERVASMAEGCAQVARLADPVGEISDLKYRPNGLQIGKMRVPLGSIGMVYESRPNVTADAAALCLKSGNAVVLRGGSEAIHSNRAIAQVVRAALDASEIPQDAVQLIDTTDREAVGALLTMPQYIDIIIPRGGKGLIERVSRDATVPVIRHLDGVCHVYIDADACLEMAAEVAYNAKARRYGICGAMETLLVAEAVAAQILPKLATRYSAKNIELRGCDRARALVADMKPATEEDWRSEYLDAILAVRVVDDLAQAIDHINTYGSHHTDAIVTQNLAHSRQFLRQVDSSSVMVNASTQFADGFEYGLGAEIGISTDKLHVRGPVGLEGLTCEKYVVFGDGHIRA